MIEKVLDEYELKARVAPGLVVALPLLVDAIYAAPVLSSWPVFAVSGVFGLALVYALGYVARARGRAIERGLWSRWGGPPSIRLMRSRDATLSKDMKKAISTAVTRGLSLRLLSAEEEAKEPIRADRAIEDSFKLALQYLRQHDPNGLWHKHDIEYGFARNLLGCRILWAATAFGATVFAAVWGHKSGSGAANPASAITLLSFASALYFGWAILPSATKRIADGFAELAWIAFLGVSEVPSNRGTGGP